MGQRATVKALSNLHEKTHAGPFYITLLYLVLEYGRPQEKIPALQAVRLSGVVVVLLILSLLGSGKLRFHDTQTKLFMAFVALMAVHVPFAVNNFFAYQATMTMLITFVAYLGIVTFVDSLERFQTMVSVWISVHIYLAIIGIINGGQGVGGFFKDENDLALTLNMVIPFSFFLSLEAKTLSKRVLLLLVTGIFIVCDVITMSRGGFIGLACVGLYCWFRSPRKIASSIGVALLVIVMLYSAPERYWDEIKSVQAEVDGSKIGTGHDRLYSWNAGWRMFLDYPLLGVGPDNFPWNFLQYETPEGFGERAHGGRAAHSVYFTLIPELGIVGTAIFLMMLRTDWRYRKKISELEERERSRGDKEEPDRKLQKVRYVSLAINGSLIGFLVSGTFLSVLYYPHFWILIAFRAALVRSITEKIAIASSGISVQETQVALAKSGIVMKGKNTVW